MQTKSWHKRILAALLCVCLAACWMPTVSWAAPDTEIFLDPLNGDDHNDGSSKEEAVESVEKAMELADGGVVYVRNTVSIDSEVTLKNTVFQIAEGESDITFFRVGQGGVLTIEDATLIGNGAVTVQVNAGGTLNIKQGASLKYGASSAVQVFDGELNMYGGTISNNKSERDGGGIYLWNGTAQFLGGVVENNRSEKAGGGLCALGNSNVTIDGTIFRNNEAGTNGGGVYIEANGSKDATFVMKSGSIENNTAPNGRGGLAIMAADYNVDATLSGGTIQNNLDEDQEDTAILLGSWDTEYPVLKLSGSPNIQGAIDLWDEGEIDKGAYLIVNGAFSPAQPLCISDIYGLEGRAVVRYAQGLTPNLEDFTTSFTSTALAVEGSNLVWLDLVRIRVYTATDSGQWKSDWVYVYPNQAIDPEKLPASITKTGYSMIGYQYENAQGEWEMWDMSTPIAPTDDVRLFEKWVLDAPTAKIEASATRAHVGESIVLTANASHALSGTTYQYAWFKDGVALPGADEKTLTVTEAGSYTVKVSASNGKTTSAEAESAPVEVAFGHFIDDVWQSDDHNHWQACTECGEKLNLGAHISDGGKVTTEATETTEGVKTYACTVCGKVLKTEAIPVLASPNGANGVKTGDLSQPVLWTALLVLAAAGVGGTVLYRKKNHA